VAVPWTVGLGQLPLEGGIDDQSYIEMRMFRAFLEGERYGQLWLIRK